jgi:hypothetical protein
MNQKPDTETAFNQIVGECQALFEAKTSDYGTAWRILRPSSITDQIYIKANRIRTIQETGQNKVGDSIETEFVAIINYAVMALIQMGAPKETPLELDPKEALRLYKQIVSEIENLRAAKNHDYGEAWRQMRVTSVTDMILQKLYRLKQMEDNDYRTQVSESAKGSYQDIFNYAAFALIHLRGWA